MKRCQITIIDKERLVKAYDLGQDWITLSEQLEIKYQTAHTIIRKWRDTKSISNGKRGGYKKFKITEEIGLDLLSFVEENNLFKSELSIP